MAYFDVISREYINPMDLNILNNTFNTLEKGHQEAIKAASNLEIEMSKLNLNEAESAWRQQRINEIRDIVANNTVYGNAYASLDDLIAKAGNIASDPGMIGRLKAQQDYETFQKELDATKEIPEYMKDMFREANPYHYEDTYDEQGNVIGGTKWQPNKRYINTIPINQLMEEAAKLAKPDAGKYSKTRWLDKDGNITDDFNKSVTGEYFDITTGKWAELSKDKLKEALETVIRNTPGAIDSLKQDYDYEEWSAGKNNGFNPAIQNKDGQKLNFKEYLNKRFDPFYEAATYRHFESDIEYGKVLSAQRELTALTNPYSKDGTYKNPLDSSAKDPLQYDESTIKLDNWLPNESVARMSSAKQYISDLFKKYNPNININLNELDSNAIQEKINEIITDPEDNYNALVQQDIIEDAEEYINYITKDKDLDDVAGFKLYNAITSFSDLPSFEDNEKGKELKEYYNKLIDARFNNGKATAIRNYFSDDDTYDRFIELIGGQDAVKSLGIKVGNKNGKKYVELPKENNKSYYTYASAIRNAIKDTHNWFGQNWEYFKNSVYGGWGDNAVYINEDGTESFDFDIEIKDIGAPMPSDIITQPYRTLISQESNPFVPYGTNSLNIEEEIVDFVDNLKPAYDNVLENSILELGQRSLSQSSPDVVEITSRIKAGEKDLSGILKVSEDEALTIAKRVNPVQSGAYIISDDGSYHKANSEERMDLYNKLRTAKDNDLDRPTMILDPRTGKWSPIINLRYKDGDEDKAITFMIPGGYNNETSDSWNRRTETRAANEVMLSSASGKPIRIFGREGFGNLELKLIPNGDYFVDNNTNKIYTKREAQEIANLRNIWLDTYRLYKGGYNISKEQLVNTIDYVSANLAAIMGRSDTARETLANTLLDSLK